MQRHCGGCWRIRSGGAGRTPRRQCGGGERERSVELVRRLRKSVLEYEDGTDVIEGGGYEQNRSGLGVVVEGAGDNPAAAEGGIGCGESNSDSSSWWGVGGRGGGGEIEKPSWFQGESIQFLSRFLH